MSNTTHTRATDGAALPTFSVSRFTSKQDNAPRAENWTLAQTAERLTTYSHRTAKDGAAWSPATFDGKRAKENAVAVCALVLDYDDGADPVDATRDLDARGVCYILHTTHSHTPDAPKFRVVLPLARPVAACDWPSFYERAARHFGQGKTDASCKDASRLYFLPACPKSRASDVIHFYLPGALLDPDDVPAENTPARPVPAAPTATANAGDLRPYVRAAFDREVNAVALAPNGTRNPTLNRAAFSLFQIVAAGELDAGTVESALLDAATGAGLSETEVRRTLQSARDAGLKSPRQMPAPRQQTPPPMARQSDAAAPVAAAEAQPEISDEARGPYALNEIGNGKRFADANRGRYLYDYPASRWRVYAGGVWRPTDGDDVERAAKEIEAQICDEARAENDDDRRAKLYKHAASITKRKTRETMLKDAASEIGLSAPPENFDAQLHLFNVKNGTLDLRTGELKPHAAPDLLTKVAGTSFDPSASAPTWTRALETWMPDAATRDYLQECAGLSLSGEVRDEFFNFLFGGGANGKTTFLSTLERVSGDYHRHAKAEIFMRPKFVRDGEASSPGLLSLQGARLLTVSEIEGEHEMSAALVKGLTGRDPITARGNYDKRPTTFRPQFTLWMFGNEKPKISDASDGMWRRVRLIEFNQTIPRAERDPDFAGRLNAELPGVLNWALEGLRRVQQRGLIVPDAVQVATASYRAEQSPLDGFLCEMCEQSRTAFVTAADLWDAWKTYCAEMDEPEGTQRAFSNVLKGRFKDARTYIAGRQTRVWNGVKLR